MIVANNKTHGAYVDLGPGRGVGHTVTRGGFHTEKELISALIEAGRYLGPDDVVPEGIPIEQVVRILQSRNRT